MLHPLIFKNFIFPNIYNFGTLSSKLPLYQNNDRDSIVSSKVKCKHLLYGVSFNLDNFKFPRNLV